MLKPAMGRIRPIGPIGLILASALATAGAAEVAWDTVIRLTTNPASQVTGYSGQHSVVADGEGSVYVAWLDQRDVPYQVWGRCYDADSHIWQSETVLTNRPANCFRPGIACDSAGSVHLAWHMDSYLGPGIWYKRFDATTGSWKPDTLIDTTTTLQPQSYPSITCVPGTGAVAVAWYGMPDTGMYAQVFLKERHPSTGWDSAVQVSSAATSHDQVSVAAGRTGDLAVVWVGRDFGGDYNQVYCRRRVVGTWQGVELVSDIPLALRQYSPSVAFDPEGAVHAVWYGRTLNSGYFQVFHRMWDHGGWSGIDSISGTRPYQQQYPSIACDAMGRCHAVWCSQAGGTNFQLAYGQRDTNGVWSSPMILTGLDSGDVSHPSIACDADSGIHIVWYDASSGNQDVYYLRGFTPGAGVIETRPSSFVLGPGLRSNLLRCGSLRPQSGMKLYDPCGRSVTDLKPGVYFLRMSDGGRYRRLVVVH
jgi:hypothetical protein